MDKFIKSKIYEKLDYLETPSSYNGDIPWVLQNQIAATNGIHYANRVGKLNTVPEYSLPVSNVSNDSIMLDIGSGWGRWLVAAAKKGYIPVGIDLRLEFCETQQYLLKSQNIKGYSVVADLEALPFQENIFDLIWSFSVIQHTHQQKLNKCLYNINQIVNNSGKVLLEFPNKGGIRNRFIYNKVSQNIDDYNSWDVRYYTISEYQNILSKYLSSIKFTNHSFLGIGILPEDIKYVSTKNKIICSISRFLSNLAGLVPFLINFSDSLYFEATKSYVASENASRSRFLEKHKNSDFDNLNIIELLKCPISEGNLLLDESKTKVISPSIQMYFPIVNNIPIIVKSEAQYL